MRRAQHKHAPDDPAIEHFSRNHASFDRFAYANIVRDQQTDGFELEREYQGQKLVRARPEGEPPRASERSRATAQKQAGGIQEKATGGWIADHIGIRSRKARGFDALALERKKQPDGSVASTSYWLEIENVLSCGR